MRLSELTMSQQKCRVTRYRLIEKLHGAKSILLSTVNVSVGEELFCSQVKIIGSQVVGRSLLDGRFFFR